MRNIIFALLLGLFSLSVMGQADKTAPKWDLTRPNPKNETEMNSMTRMQEGSEVWRDDQKAYFRYVNGAWIPEPSGGGSGDFKADGSVPATGSFDMDFNDLLDIKYATFRRHDTGTQVGTMYMPDQDRWYFTKSASTLGAVLNLGNINTSSKVFSFPNASGTFALTSDLTSFLESGDNISELTNDSGYITSQTDDQNASEVPFTPYLTITSTNTQAAIQELKDEVDSGSGTDDQTASEVPITDSGNNYTGTEVETALSEIADSLSIKVNINPNSSPVEVFRGTYAEAQAEYGVDPNTWPEKLFGIIPDYPETEISLDDLSDVIKGSVATNSSGTLRVLADPNEDGDYNEIDWTPPSGGLSNVVDDLTPQLGGALDMNSQTVTGDIIPTTNDNFDLGSSSSRFTLGYINGIVMGGGSLTGVANIVPLTDGGSNLGSSSNSFQYFYLEPTDIEASAVEGAIYFDNSENTLKQYNGTAWEALNGLGGGASELSDLSDVSDATPTDDYALMGNGTTFASRPLVEADISDLGDYAELGSVNTWTQQNTFSNTAVMSGTLLVTSNSGIILQPTDNAFAGVVRYHTPSSLLGHYALSEGIGSSWFNSDGSFNIGHTFSGPTTKTTAFDFSEITAKRTLIVPDASGTIALTSDLGGSVPDDTGSSNGDVLTTDGAGTYTWETPIGGVLQEVTLTLTDVDFTGGSNVDNTILAAQGAGTIIEPVQVIVYADGITSTATTTTWQLNFVGDGAPLANHTAVGAGTTQTGISSDGANYSRTSFDPENVGVNFRLTHATAESTTGSFRVKLLYRVWTF